MSELEAIGCLMALKCKFDISRDEFDDMVVVFGRLLPKPHNLPHNMYESQKMLRVLKMPYESIYACTNGCILFWKDHADAKYFPKCKSSRYLEVDFGDGQKRQLEILDKILRYLLFIQRIQRLNMTEESAQ